MLSKWYKRGERLLVVHLKVTDSIEELFIINKYFASVCDNDYIPANREELGIAFNLAVKHNIIDNNGNILFYISPNRNKKLIKKIVEDNK